MGLKERLVAAGFNPVASTDGEWQPYIGTYKVTWETLRLEKDKNGNPYWTCEWNIIESLKGDPKRNSKYADFRQAYFFDLANEDERSMKQCQQLLNAAFTFGVDLDITSNETLADSASESLIHKEGYIRGYPRKKWLKEGEDWVEDIGASPRQGISFQKSSVAEKSRTKESLAF